MFAFLTNGPGPVRTILINGLIALTTSFSVLLNPCFADAFVGSNSCRDCHAEAFSQWQGSHHDLAMQLPSPATVLGNFDDASF